MKEVNKNMGLRDSFRTAEDRARRRNWGRSWVGVAFVFSASMQPDPHAKSFLVEVQGTYILDDDDAVSPCGFRTMRLTGPCHYWIRVYAGRLPF